MSTAPTAAVEDSVEEDILCTDDGFDNATAISRASCSEVDDPSFPLPVDDGR